MTGGELINRLYEEVETGGFTDAEIVQSDVIALLNKIGIPTDYSPITSRILTEAEIEAGKTPRGGFTRKRLESWGVPWPPPKGWRRRLTGKQQAIKITTLGADQGDEG